MSKFSSFLICAILGSLSSESLAQQSVSDFGNCGENCLYAAAKLHGLNVDYDHVSRLVDPDGDGQTTLESLRVAAIELGMFPTGIKLLPRKDQVESLEAPAIVHMKVMKDEQEGSHFVIFLGVDKDESVVILDPPGAPKKIKLGAFLNWWTGYSLVIHATEQDSIAYKGRIGFGLWRLLPDILFWLLIGLCCFLPFRFRSRKNSATEISARLLIFLLCCTMVGCKSSQQGPELSIETAKDFGLVSAESDLFIELSNTGTEVLEFTSLKSSCDCLMPKTVSPIKPGGSGLLHVVPSPGNFGRRMARLLLETNEVNKKSHQIEISWLAVEEPSVFPEALEFRGAENELVKGIVRFRFSGGRDEIDISYHSRWNCLVVGQEHCVTSEVKDLPGGTSYLQSEITVELSCVLTSRSDNKPVDIFELEYEFGGRRGIKEIPLMTIIEPRFRTVPQKITFVARNEAGFVGQSRRVGIFCPGGVPMVSNSPEFLSCRIARPDTDSLLDYYLIVTVKEGELCDSQGYVELATGGTSETLNRERVSVDVVLLNRNSEK